MADSVRPEVEQAVPHIVAGAVKEPVDSFPAVGSSPAAAIITIAAIATIESSQPAT